TGKLLLNNISYPLGQDNIEIPPTLDPVAIELYAPDGRLVDFQGQFPDREGLASVRDRRARIALFAGTASDFTRKWQRGFLSTSFAHFLAEGSFRFKALNLRLGVNWVGQNREYSEGFSASYSALRLPVGVAYDLPLFSRATGYFRKVYVSPMMGVFYSWRYLTIADDYIDIAGFDRGLGGYYGVDIRFPLMGNFSIHGRLTGHYEAIRFATVDLTIYSHQVGLWMGMA